LLKRILLKQKNVAFKQLFHSLSSIILLRKTFSTFCKKENEKKLQE